MNNILYRTIYTSCKVGTSIQPNRLIAITTPNAVKVPYKQLNVEKRKTDEPLNSPLTNGYEAHPPAANNNIMRGINLPDPKSKEKSPFVITNNTPTYSPKIANIVNVYGRVLCKYQIINTEIIGAKASIIEANNTPGPPSRS